MSVVLRVYGSALELDRGLALIPADQLESAWRAGELGALGRVHKTSGFSVLLTSEEEAQRVVPEAMLAFLEIAPHISALVQDGASAEIDFAVFVTDAKPETLTLEPEMLRELVRYGVRLVISAYPTSGDDDGEA